MTKIIFLDRDGTINVKPPTRQYLRTPTEIEYLPGVKEALRVLAEDDFRFVIATNQAGIATGAVTKEEVDAVNRVINDDLKRAGIPIIGWYVCPHREEDQCFCRKPKPGLMLEAAKNLDLSLLECWNVGDSPRDILMGIAAGCNRNILVASGYNPRPDELVTIKGTALVETMADVVDLILKSDSKL